MKKYSITKYFKEKYTNGEEWTAISDIAKIYLGKQLSIEDYKKMEDAYVDAILKIANYMKIEKFKIKDVFRWKDLIEELKPQSNIRSLYTASMLETYKNVTDTSVIGYTQLSDLIRLELREDIGGLLYVPYRLKIFIGYDYMMGVHSSIPLENIFEYIENLGLNIYQFK